MREARGTTLSLYSQLLLRTNHIIPRSSGSKPTRVPHLTHCRYLRQMHSSDFKSAVLMQSKLWCWCARSPPGWRERDDSWGTASKRATSKEGQKLCLQESRERVPTSAVAAGRPVSSARNRGWWSRRQLQGRGGGPCKGSVMAELLLTMRGSSCH